MFVVDAVRTGLAKSSPLSLDAPNLHNMTTRKRTVGQNREQECETNPLDGMSLPRVVLRSDKNLE